MNISLPPPLERFVTHLIEEGLFDSENEIVCAGLRLLQDQHELYKIRLVDLRKEIAVGIEQADRGELIDGADVFRKLRERAQQHSCQPT